MRTLDDLANELATRLGFGAQQGASIIQQPMLYSALRSAQAQLYEEFGQELLLVVNEYDPGFLVNGEALYDLADDCDPNRITEVSICHGGRYYEIDRGIITRRRNAYDYCSGNDPLPAQNVCDPPEPKAMAEGTDTGRPVRWDIRLGNDGKEPYTDQRDDVRKGQIEFWPVPDSNYGVRYAYYRKMLPFLDKEDRASINEELILLHALVTMKSHYRQPDAQIYVGQLSNMLGRIRGKQLNGLRFNKLRQRHRSAPHPFPGVQHELDQIRSGRTVVTLDTVDTENPNYDPVLTEDN
jgi:hypothetical protein